MQYKQEYIKDLFRIVPALILIGLFFNWLNTPETITIQAKSEVVVESLVASPDATTAPIPDDVEGYIVYRFGKNAPKAFLLLQGDGSPNACAENKTLDPKAINYNWTSIKGVWSSRDRGLFQINDKFHPGVSDECAFDFKCNTDYSYRMFLNDGGTFSKRWTCGMWYKSLGYDI